MLTNEFDRMSARIATLESENQQLIKEKEAGESKKGAFVSMPAIHQRKHKKNRKEKKKLTEMRSFAVICRVQTEVELQVVQKDIKIVELSKQVQDLEAQLDAERASSSRELSVALEQVQVSKRSVDDLQRQISALPTLEEYNKLKTKVSALKAFEMEMGAEIPEGMELTPELILREKNRKLETENIKMKV
jgi:hypothetical protein